VCHSTRRQHEVSHQRTSDLPCPSPEEALAAAALVGAIATASDQQQHFYLLQLLLDALEVADVASGTGLQLLQPDIAVAGGKATATPSSSSSSSSKRGHVQLAVALDERHHCSRSLLHPGLAVAQGPALCLVFQGLVLSPLEIAKLVGARPPGGGSNSNRGVTVAAAAGGGGGGLGLGGWDVHGSRVGSGSGLKGVWAVSDVVQVVSGHYLSLLDPTGGHLGGGGGRGGRGAASAAAAAPGVGQHYDMRQGDVLARFRDQFIPWDIHNAG
jgi:hypothetical protein